MVLIRKAIAFRAAGGQASHEDNTLRPLAIASVDRWRRRLNYVHSAFRNRTSGPPAASMAAYLTTVPAPLRAPVSLLEYGAPPLAETSAAPAGGQSTRQASLTDRVGGGP